MPVVRILKESNRRIEEIRERLKREGYLLQGYAPVVSVDEALAVALDAYDECRAHKKLQSPRRVARTSKLLQCPGGAGPGISNISQAGEKLQKEGPAAHRATCNISPGRPSPGKKLQSSGRRLKVLELFCATKSISRACESRGHETRTLDNNKRFYPDYLIDIMKFRISMLGSYRPNMVWISSPCTAFSPSSRGVHFEGSPGSYKPITKAAEHGMALVRRSLAIVKELNPDYWFFENPVGVLRHLDILDEGFRKTVTYCSYGWPHMKLTDIWTNCEEWTPRKLCNPKTTQHRHINIEGAKNAIERARIPPELALEICLAVERSG